MAAGSLLIQVLAQLKPARCGVSDQAVLLAAELRNSFGIDSAFVVLNSSERSDVPWPVIHCAPARLLESCLELSRGNAGTVLVHVSGYGYSPDGAPTLLANALEKLKDDGRFRVAAYFHEISASGPPWTSAFWHGPRQKAAIRKIVQASGLVATNIGANARWLERETQRSSRFSAELLPVFSAAGEASALIPQSQRAPVMSIFGLPATRVKSYRQLLAAPDLFKDLEIEEILDIGGGSVAPQQVNGVPVKRRGEVDVKELANELSRVRCGFLSYNPVCLAKSSIFATYCAQGTVPIVAERLDGEIDGLRDGLQLLSPRTAREAFASGLDQCAEAARRWYAGHRVYVHAQTYARWMNQTAAMPVQEEARR